MRAFHPKLIYFGGVEVIYPCFDGIESDSFSNHVATTLTSYMEGCFISNFASTYSLAFNDFEWFILLKLAFFWRHFLRVVILGVVKVICPSCSQTAHLSMEMDWLV
jgi:hypothetical protein